MPLGGLRNAIPFRRKKSETQRPDVDSAVATTKLLPANALDTWSSTSEDFTHLRFMVWTGGDPGFTLTTSADYEDDTSFASWDENAELKVERVTSLKGWEAGVRPGDVMETVANKRVHTMDTEAALVLVRMAKSPSIVRFRSKTKGDRVRFDVLLGRQKLGVSFTGDGCHGVPVVTRINSSFRYESQNGTSPSGIRLGDLLVAVNGMDAIAAGLEPTMKYVESCPRPLRLTFERAANDGNFRDRQVASEQSGENIGGSFVLRTIPSLAVSGMKASAVASVRCKEFLRSLMPPAGFCQQLFLDGSLEEYHDKSPHLIETPSEVFIEWTSGPLGLTLMEDAISGSTIVNRLTGKGSSANLEHLQHGFQLYSINGELTEGLTMKEVCQNLLSLPKPVQLVFRPPRASESGDSWDSHLSSPTYSPPASPSFMPARSSVGLDADAHRALVSQVSTSQRYGSHQIPLHEQNEYEVLWTTPRLELQLKIPGQNEVRATKNKTLGNKLAAQDRYPTIHKILKECVLDLPKDAVGDLFVSVNHWNTSGLSVAELQALMKVATKPALLRFRRREDWPGFQLTLLSNSSRSSSEGVMSSALGSAYSILWTEGKLGITFGCYEDADCRNALVVYVKRIEDGQAKSSKMVGIGDVLCSINGKELPSKQKFEKTVRGLVNSNRPVTLGFRRLLVECSPGWGGVLDPDGFSA